MDSVFKTEDKQAPLGQGEGFQLISSSAMMLHIPQPQQALRMFVSAVQNSLNCSGNYSY